MRLKNLELHGFKSFAKKTVLEFTNPVVSIVGPNGSGKSNVVEAIRYVLGEQSMKSMRGKSGSDMIFKGSQNLPKGTKASVTIYFDNTDKIFKLSNDMGEMVNLNFDTVSISRETYADGLNKYNLNGSEVRLKDIHALLASVNIGSSGHHIISQGEADRILNTNPKERKEMIEDALGLKVYQYKIKESERKLERTEENMKEVSMLRRENAPHLIFLKKQVEKFEKAKEMQVELASLLEEYLKKESVYLNEEKSNLIKEREKLEAELKAVHKELETSSEHGEEKRNKNIQALENTEREINNIRSQKNELERKLGRIEGILEAKENKVKTGGKCPMCGSDLRQMDEGQAEKIEHDRRELEELKTSQQNTVEEMAKLRNSEADLINIATKLREDINKEMESLRDREREKFSHKVKQQEISSGLNLVRVKEENLTREVGLFETEIKEGQLLVGHYILSYKNFNLPEGDRSAFDRNAQEEAKKKIERIKFKLEDMGSAGGAEIMKEYEEVNARDQFLVKETEDLEKSIESLSKIMAELKEKIDVEFKEGLKKINVEFKEFFALMFGGGSGSLNLVTPEKRGKKDKDEMDEDEEALPELEDDKEPEQGIEINISLPHKKVKELQALSGGERSLTSIALLFAMSQVNPPPFLVLDETDAALDEANSRKYGDMIERLSKHSQLIVVTHNRETMSRAGMLYGVTLGSDSASKLLSVRFDEAVAIAK
jgi:chromosome segregation protein